jgi:hypothetical protein
MAIAGMDAAAKAAAVAAWRWCCHCSYKKQQQKPVESREEMMGEKDERLETFQHSIARNNRYSVLE